MLTLVTTTLLADLTREHAKWEASATRYQEVAHLEDVALVLELNADFIATVSK